MSDVPIGRLPDPDAESNSGIRSEVMSTLGSAASRVGRAVGSAVATGASARSSVTDVLSGAAQGVKDLSAEVDKFVSRSSTKFETTLGRVSKMLQESQRAAEGLGSALGSTGKSMMGWRADSDSQIEKSLANARGQGKADHAVQTVNLGPSQAASSGGPIPNGGEGAGSGVRGGGDYVINANKVVVSGGGGGGAGGAAAGAGPGEEEQPNGGWRRVGNYAARVGGYTALLGIGAGVRAAGRSFTDISSNLRPQQTAFQRAGFGSITAQQGMMRSYLNTGVSHFGQEDLTAALNIGVGNLGGTNFRMESLANMQRASLDMGAEQAASVATTMATPGVRNRLYQYGISTKGLSADERLLEAARFALQKRPGESFTEQDYNTLSTQGEAGFANLQYLTGGSEQAMQAARDLVGQRAGFVGLSAANATLQSEVGRDTSRARMNNEILEEVAGLAEFRNEKLTQIYDAVSNSSDGIQQTVATVGALSGAIMGLLGGVGLAGIGSGAANIFRSAGGFTSQAAAHSAGLVGPVRTATSALTKFSVAASAATAVIDQGLRLWQGLKAGGGIREAFGDMGDRSLSVRERFDQTLDVFDHFTLSPTRIRVPFTDMSIGNALRSDEGDPPPGSAIRTHKPVGHVTGLHPKMRSALERMFRDNPKLHLTSGARSRAHQERLWNKALRDHGSPEAARKWVAPPGSSKHEQGLAADIGPDTEYPWLRRNAAKYGLHVPLSNEDWHVELQGSRSGKELVDINIQSGGSESTSRRDSSGRNKQSGIGSFFGLGSVTSSEGDLFAALLGADISGGGGSTQGVRRAGAGSSVGSGSSGYDTMLGDLSGSFSGSLAERAAAVARVAKAEGFSGSELQTMVAIALAESSGNPRAHNPDASTGDNSYGLWQINMLGDMGPSRRRWFGISSNEELFDPAVNADAAEKLYRARGNFNDWSVYKNNDYRDFLDEAAAGVSAVGDPPSAAGVDGSPRGGGGSVVMQGGSKKVIMHIHGQQSPRALAEKVRAILAEEDDFEMVGTA